jgi:hypothetical protein
MRLARICKLQSEMKPQTLEFGQIIVRLNVGTPLAMVMLNQADDENGVSW